MEQLMTGTIRQGLTYIFILALTFSLPACSSNLDVTPNPGTAGQNNLETASVDETPAIETVVTAPVSATAGVENSATDLTRLEIAYEKSGNLWVSGNGQNQEVSHEGTDSHPVLSKDNQLIAFQRGGELWVMDLSGENQRKIFNENGLKPYQYEFAGNTHKIYFTTSTSAGQPRFDLNLADADRGDFQNLLAEGQGGKFTFSPDLKAAALVQPGKILIYIPATGKSQVVYQFQPVKAAGGYFLAPLVWLSDGYGFNTVIPALEGKPALYIFIPAAGGKTAQLAEFNPVLSTGNELFISPDGSKVLYLKAQADNLEMHVVDASTADRTYLRKPAGKIGILGWGPDSINMVFWADEAQYVYFSNGMAVSRLAEKNNTPITGLLWLNPNLCVVVSGSNLVQVVPGQSAQIIDSGVAGQFDAISLP